MLDKYVSRKRSYLEK